MMHLLIELPLWAQLLLPALFAAVFTYLLTPPVKHMAERLQVYDYPDKYRHVNEVPVARMGGLSMGISMVVTILIFSNMNIQIIGMLAGAMLIVAMGLLDDFANLPPYVKLLVQILAALVAYRSGIIFNVVSNFNFISPVEYFHVDIIALPLTILWIVGCTNALNLIDGLDGLAAGVAVISCLTMLVVALLVSEPIVALLLAIITGACIGFLPFNFNPAKIFMGDVGSQLLGYLISVTSIMGMFKVHALVTLFVPLLALAIPLADTIFAFFRRILRGQSPFTADSGHLHHRLLALGLTQKQAVAVLSSVSALFGLIAVIFTASSHRVLRLVTVLAALVIALGIGTYVLHAHRKEKPLKTGKSEADE